MAPPSYAELGRHSRGLFNVGYNFGYMKLDTTTKSASNIEFGTSASQNVATGKLFGSLNVKYRLPQYGMVLTERWNTDNNLGTEITITDKLTKGLKLTLDSSFAPQLGKRSGKMKVDYGHDHVRLNTDVTLDTKGPIIGAAAVAGYEGFLMGYNLGFDTQRSKLTHSNLALGKQTSSYALHTFINDGSEFGGSVWHRVSERTELAANLGWTTGEQATRFGVAAKYRLDDSTTVRAKLSNAAQMALAMTHALSPNMTLTMSTLVNMQNFNEGGHKFGIGLEYEPY